MAMNLTVIDKNYVSQLIAFLVEIGPDLPCSLGNQVSLEEHVDKLISLGCVMAILAGKEIVGVCGGYMNDWKERKSVITVMGFHSSARENGEGEHLIKAFEQEAIRAGMRILELETSKTNTSAIRFYENSKFRLVKHQSNGNVLMRKILVGICEERPNILLTSVGRRTYLVKWFKDALNGSGEVHAVNSDNLSPALIAADKATVCPIIYSDEYIPFLVDYCKNNKIGAVFPLFDIDIPILAANKSRFNQIGCLPVTANLISARCCNDKYETYLKLRETCLPTIPSFIELEECERALNSNEISFPLILKPRWGMGSIGVHRVCSNEELRFVYRMVQREINNTYLKYEAAIDSDKSVLIQVAVDGQEYGLDVINDLNGEYQSVVVKKKIAMRAGETDSAEVIPAEGRFIELARRLSYIICQPGNLDVDVFDVDGELFVLEMNARFGGGYPFSHAAGVDLPKALVLWLTGKSAPASLLSPQKYGRYFKDITIVDCP